MKLSKLYDFSVSLCEYSVLGFALWTISSHVTAFTAGGLWRLLLTFACMSVLALYGVLRYRSFSKYGHSEQENQTRKLEVEHAARFQHALWAVVLVLAVCLTLLARHPDADDSHYINFAVTAVDHPHDPILRNFNLHSVPVPPGFFYIPYRVQAIEMLAAAISLITSTPVIYTFHILFPLFTALLVIISYAQLFRILTPRYWAYGVLAAMVFLCANGDVHRSYGNFSFVRLHQGKGMLLSIMVPLIITYGIHFARHPTFRNWIVLTCAQIAAVGLSVNGLLTAPVVALLAVVVGVPDMSISRRLCRVALGVLSSSYVLAVGVFVTLLHRSSLPDVVGAPPEPIDPFQTVSEAMELVFGHGPFAFASICVIFTAWFFAESRTARRLCVIFPIAFLLLFLNPLLVTLWVEYVTTSYTFWRVFWTLPLPAMAGIVLIAPFSMQRPQLSLRMRTALYAALLLGLSILLPKQNIFAGSNSTRLGVPGLKVTQSYQVAEIMCRDVGAPANILAPEAVTAWITTMHRHPYPLLARYYYDGWVGEEGHPELRLRLKLYISGLQRAEHALEVFQLGLRLFEIKGVAFHSTNPWAVEIGYGLQRSGFERRHSVLGYEIWTGEPGEKVKSTPHAP